MTKEEYLEFCGTIGGAVIDKPFHEDFESIAVRREDNKKWFAVLLKYQNRDIVNLKLDPMECELEAKLYEGIIPAYHMNKTHWVSVFLESDVPEEEIERLTLVSFGNTEKGKCKPKKS